MRRVGLFHVGIGMLLFVAPFGCERRLAKGQARHA
jgi:hypothetical protein